MVTKAQKDAQDAAAKQDQADAQADSVDQADAVDSESVETPEQRHARLKHELDDFLAQHPDIADDVEQHVKASGTDTPAADDQAAGRGETETREQARARLSRELAELDDDAARHGGYKEIPTHIGVLLCGDQVQVSNANATQHFCEEHGVEVNFIAFHAIPEHLREKLIGTS